MARQELKFPDWLREARRKLHEQGPTALRDDLAEHVDEPTQKALLIRLLQELGAELPRDIQTEAEGLDEIVTLVNALDLRDGVLEDLRDSGLF
jgi:hypothetical protein